MLERTNSNLVEAGLRPTRTSSIRNGLCLNTRDFECDSIDSSSTDHHSSTDHYSDPNRKDDYSIYQENPPPYAMSSPPILLEDMPLSSAPQWAADQPAATQPAANQPALGASAPAQSAPAQSAPDQHPATKGCWPFHNWYCGSRGNKDKSEPLLPRNSIT
ncbi:uncharacterized protein PAC_00585 [Phialocephala subalpina]|uniref:Uncharacterized protein n=1 Tax=Phialocephala subalpina TaxID=576137 RepID=A0A1L7WD54_9HELO|nr:uncharacterized protein PAC_00585 [Phialocephala subalpina]